MKRYLVCLVALLIMLATYCEGLSQNIQHTDILLYSSLNTSIHKNISTCNVLVKPGTQIHELNPGIDYRLKAMFARRSLLYHRALIDSNFLKSDNFKLIPIYANDKVRGGFGRGAWTGAIIGAVVGCLVALVAGEGSSAELGALDVQQRLLIYGVGCATTGAVIGGFVGRANKRSKERQSIEH